MKFTGTQNYVATEDLTVAVNAAVLLERPLLIKGEPGTGKTELAKQVASALGFCCQGSAMGHRTQVPRSRGNDSIT